MLELFSAAFTGIFLVFGAAVIIGHLLLAEALVRPFFASLAANRPAIKNAVLANR